MSSIGAKREYSCHINEVSLRLDAREEEEEEKSELTEESNAFSSSSCNRLIRCERSFCRVFSTSLYLLLP